MTNIYFVRHAKVTYTVDDHTRPLSEQGKIDVIKVIEFFREIKIDNIISSPYERAIHTIEGVANNKGLKIKCYDNLHERKVAYGIIDDFKNFTKKQWKDFGYKLDGGESLAEVQKRGNDVLREILDTYKDKNIIIGTHGTFLAVILNFYDTTYDFNFWKTMRMPDIYKLKFEKDKLIAIKHYEI